MNYVATPLKFVRVIYGYPFCLFLPSLDFEAVLKQLDLNDFQIRKLNQFILRVGSSHFGKAKI